MAMGAAEGEITRSELLALGRGARLYPLTPEDRLAAIRAVRQALTSTHLRTRCTAVRIMAELDRTSQAEMLIEMKREEIEQDRLDSRTLDRLTELERQALGARQLGSPIPTVDAIPTDLDAQSSCEEGSE